jgi:hypothetical protein
MDYRSTLIRNVEIPSTLPSMETLTKLTGSIIIKDVEQAETGVRIEGDLLWRGFFEEEGADGGECLWEGAEYFAETIDGDKLRTASSPLIEPQVVSLKGEALSDSTFRLAFDIRWYGQPEREEEYLEATAKESATCPCQQKAKQSDKNTAAPMETAAPAPKKRHPQAEETEFEEKLKDIDHTWREKVKTFQLESAAAENTKTVEKMEKVEIAETMPKREEAKTAEPTKQEEAREEPLKCCPYSAYCLRYYRIQEGDQLEKIAEKFSATVARLKEYNALEDSHVKSGRLIRIP